MNKINAIGDKCPIPVVKAKNELKNMEVNSQLIITVDNETATENLGKLAKELGYKYSIESTEDGNYEVGIIKTVKDFNLSGGGNTVVVISAETMGQGSQELGAALMASFIYALSELDYPPKTLIFYNGGAKLTSEGSKSIEDIKKLEEKGAEILTCGACMDYYSIKDKLAAGSVTNMYDIAERLIKASNIIKP